MTSSNSVWWNSGTFPTGSSVTFEFDSPNPYAEVNCTIKAGRLSTSGTTLGMMALPELRNARDHAFGDPWAWRKWPPETVYSIALFGKERGRGRYWPEHPMLGPIPCTASGLPRLPAQDYRA